VPKSDEEEELEIWVEVMSGAFVSELMSRGTVGDVLLVRNPVHEIMQSRFFFRSRGASGFRV